MRRIITLSGTVALAGLLLSAGAKSAANAAKGLDWPHWRGPQYDGISRETGLLQKWPEGGPKILWQTDLPGGYSSVAIAQGRLFTQTKDNKEEIVLCLDADTGKKLWDFRYECDYDQHPSMDERFKSGPRATPTVDGDFVYTIGTTGQMFCLEARTGKKVWERDLLKLADRTCPEFGYCNSALIVGDLLFVHPGGSKGNSLAALKKKDGSVAWQALDDPIGYATPVPIEFNGQAQIIYFTANGLVAVTPADGKPLWRYEWKTDFDLNVATPIHSNGQVFISSNYGKGCALVRLKGKGDPEESWKNLMMQNWFSTSVLHEGHIYGFSNDRLRCVEFATGKRTWDQTGFGRGSLLIADGMLIILSERGELALAEANSKEFKEKARWKALDGTCWTVPVLAHGKLYLRNQKKLLAVEMVAK